MVVCRTCASEGLKSTVTPGPTFTTDMLCQPFYDEAGLYHDHDANLQSTEYWCSRGHRWTEQRHAKCPTCPCPEVL